MSIYIYVNTYIYIYIFITTVNIINLAELFHMSDFISLHQAPLELVI